MANYTNAIWQQAVHTTDQLSFPAAQQQPKKASILRKNTENFLERKIIRTLDH